MWPNLLRNLIGKEHGDDSGQYEPRETHEGNCTYSRYHTRKEGIGSETNNECDSKTNHLILFLSD